MGETGLAKDPYNVIITGVGGQGNVLVSRMLANTLVRKGYYVTVGETFGASQRGGSVMSHLRISADTNWSPQIPQGKADVLVALEPIEAVRVLSLYGNPGLKVLMNTRPIYPVGVIAGELSYPSLARVRESVEGLASSVRLIHATNEAVKLGNPILGNIIMIGALIEMGDLPVTRTDFEETILAALGSDKLEMNLKAFDLGSETIKEIRSGK